MKLSLNKKALKNLSKDAEIIPADQTPQIGGGTLTTYDEFPTLDCYSNDCTMDCYSNVCYTQGTCHTDMVCADQSALTNCPTTTTH